MNTIEDFKNTPVGAIAINDSGIRAVKKTDDGERCWLTSKGSYLSDEAMAYWEYKLYLSAPTSAHEALDMAWELAYEVKPGQVIPTSTRYLYYTSGLREYASGLREYTAETDIKVNPGLASKVRTLEPLPDPEPDWLDAPAVLAVASWCPDQKVWVPKSDGYWQSACCRYESHWDELIDVTPLYPKGQDS